MSEKVIANDNLMEQVNVAFYMGRLVEACKMFDGTNNSSRNVFQLARNLVEVAGCKVIDEEVEKSE